MARGEAEQRAARRDLYVVRMRAEREHRQGLVPWRRERQPNHAPTTTSVLASTSAEVAAACPDRSGSQIIHGQFPR